VKILITVYQIQDYGGILNHTENLIAGFRSLGHKADLIMLCYNDKMDTFKRRDGHNWPIGHSGYGVHQFAGWDGIPRFGYKGRIKEWKHNAEKYDLVIFNIPVPTVSNATKGNSDWPELYNIHTKKVAVVHDGNLQKLYPHITEVPLDGLACVHETAYNSAAFIDINRMLIRNPMRMPSQPKGVPYKKRKKGFLSLQTFKRWKRVDDLIRAIPLMNHREHMHVAGTGIEHRYMTSEAKCKDEYLDQHGNPIWRVALAHGMQYHGVVDNYQRSRLMRHNRCQLDTSWSKAYSKMGGHINRVTVEGIIQGQLPIMRDLGVGADHLWEPDNNYYMIPWHADAEEFAEALDYALDLPPKRAQTMIDAAFTTVSHHWDRQVVAQEFINLAEGDGEGATEEWPDIEDKVTKNMTHFGVTQ
jgi:glycosyltransferase involved in cell wall biosynthesis